MWEGRVVMCILVLCYGCWPVSQSCRTNSENCEKQMDMAADLPTAEERCRGTRLYLNCIRTDIANCTGNKYTDQYALNIVGLYCSSAYMCSQDLQKCYAKFSTAVRNGIQRSDLSERVQLCRDLMTEILTCQENVTSRCKNQTGLMETVRNYQKRLYMVCNDTDPCGTMLLLCHKSIIDIGTLVDIPSSNNDQASDCDRQRPIDYCGAYRQAASCIRSGLSTCGGNLTMENTLANLDNTTAQQCDPKSTCGQKVSSCMCYINKQDLSSPMAIMTTICSTYPDFERCLDNVGDECHAIPKVSAEIREVKASYLKYHRLYCTMQGGLCPPALQCLVQLPDDVFSPNPSSDTLTATFHINRLCSGADTFFGCLETASDECGPENGDVTFPEIEHNFRDMCVDLGSHQSQLSTCNNLTRCLENFHLAELGVSSFQDFGQSDQDVRRMYAGLTKTEFWCNYLTHGFQCIVRAGGPCSLGDMLIAESKLRFGDLQRVCRGPTTPAPTTPAASTPKPNGGLTARPSKENGTGALHSRPHGTLLASLILAAILTFPVRH